MDDTTNKSSLAVTCVGTTPVDGKVLHKLNNYEAMPSLSLDTYIRRRSTFFIKLPTLVNKRAAELAPALLEMERRYNKQPGARTDIHELAAPGWHEYLESVGVNPSTFRTWKRSYALKQLESMAADPTKPKPVRSSGGGGSTRSTAVVSPDNGDAIMAKAGLRLAKIMTNPLLTQEERMQQAVYRAEELIEADASGNYATTEPEAVAEPNDPITPGLSPMTVPVSASRDANELLLHAAFSAAVTAANKVTEGDITSRFYPVLTFYTNRQTVKFGKMLKAKGLRGASHRGKTGYALSTSSHQSDAPIGTTFANEYKVGIHSTHRDIYFSTPSYKTFEEAWAFVKGFDGALPDQWIEYGVCFKGGSDEVNAYGTLIMRGEPEPSHGG